jgi:hypothetical protein
MQETQAKVVAVMFQMMQWHCGILAGAGVLSQSGCRQDHHILGSL